jgi:hypothetical protein
MSDIEIINIFNLDKMDKKDEKVPIEEPLEEPSEKPSEQKTINNSHKIGLMLIGFAVIMVLLLTTWPR